MLSWLLIRVNVRIRERIYGFFRNFLLENYHNDNTKLQVNVTQDLLMLTEYLPEMIKIAYFPVALIIGVITVYAVSGSLSTLSLLTCLVFIPVSTLISRKASEYTQKIYEASQARIKLASQWIKWRDIIENWGISRRLFHRIESISNKEINYRGKDSFWRSLESYTVVFGRGFPVIACLFIGFILGQSLSTQMIFLYWFSIPFIVLILEAGRIRADYERCKKALESLYNFEDSRQLRQSEKIIFDKTWNIWNGTFAANVMMNKESFNKCWLQKLRLDDELNLLSYEFCKELKLKFDGENISAGQKTRVLLLRAIHIMIATQKRLYIDVSFESLDPDAAFRVNELLNELKKDFDIQLSEVAFSSLNDQLEKRAESLKIVNSTTAQDVSSNPANNHKSVTYYIKSFFQFEALLFLLPALVLSLGSTLLINDQTTFTKLLGLSTLFISALLFAAVLGVRNERYTREWAKEQCFDLLKKGNLLNKNDTIQRISKDYLTVQERISWYIHDITWFSALVLISIISLVYSFHLLGLVLVGFFLLASLMTFNGFMKPIIRAREQQVKETNNTILVAENIHALGNINKVSSIDEIKISWVNSAIEKLCNSTNQLYRLKLNLCNIASVIPQALLASALLAANFTLISNAQLIFIFTAILAVDSVFPTYFRAITGFYASKLSIDRLTDIEKFKDHGKSSFINFDQNGIKFVAQKNDVNVNYQSTLLPRKQVYSLVGHSGSGKTLLLKAMAGIIRSQSEAMDKNIIPALYINQESIELYSLLHDNNTLRTWDSNLLRQFINENTSGEVRYQVLILDEALNNIEVNYAKEIVSTLDHFVVQRNGIVILVDHRFECDNVLTLEQFQKK